MQLVDLRKEGVSVPKLASIFGVSCSLVYVVLSKNGLSSRRRTSYTRLSAAQRAELVTAYCSGTPSTVLRGHYGVSVSTITRLVRSLGLPVHPAGFRKGPAHHAWNNGRTLVPGGYVLVRIEPDDPFFCMANKKVKGCHYVLEHRLVMARRLGRPLERHETVHHIDGNRSNNAGENLQLRRGKHGSGSAFRCQNCGSCDVVAVPLDLGLPMLKVRKFNAINLMELHLNGGVIGGTARKGQYDLVGKTLVFTEPDAFTVTFTAGTTPGVAPLLTFKEVCAQINAQSTDNVLAWAEGDALALRQKVPAADGGIAIGSASTALSELGFGAGKAVVGKVYNYADGVTAPTVPYYVDMTSHNGFLVLMTQE